MVEERELKKGKVECKIREEERGKRQTDRERERETKRWNVCLC